MPNIASFYEYLDFNGAKLFTVVCLPKESGTFPTVIIRTPYVNADEFTEEEQICQNKIKEYNTWLQNGYAVIFQHCRGSGRSSGYMHPYLNERADGLFLQDWIRNQPFYNGELYLYGHSYTASVHFVTSPFAEDIKGAVLHVQDCERYNCNYRNGFYKIALHGEWYVEVYKHKGGFYKNYNKNSYNLLPLSDFSKTVFGESVEDFDEILKHPDRNDEFWNTSFGGYEAHNAVKHANIPILLVTGFYDIYTGGIFDMWNTLDEETKSKSALAVHPFDHGNIGEGQPINFENGNIDKEFADYAVRWVESVRGKATPPFEKGKVTYFNLFENQWRCDHFENSGNYQKFVLGEGEVTYEYDPDNPATFKGGLSANFGGNAWQEKQTDRDDIITLYTPEFSIDTWVKGKMRARLKVKSSCEDTCFYIRISLCKNEGDYGLRDDINKISNFNADYVKGEEIELNFSFDEHSFVIGKGEKLRIDISSSAFPLYVRHTNLKGLFSEQTKTQKALNTVVLKESFVEIPLA